MPGDVTWASSDVEVDYTQIFSIQSGSNTIWDSRTAVGGSGPGQPIYDFNIVGPPRSAYLKRTEDGETSFSRPADVVAFECGLWFCLQAYYVNTTLGHSVEHVAEHWNTAQSLGNGGDLDSLFYFTDVPASFNIEDDVDYGVSGTSISVYTQAVEDAVVGSVLSDGLAEFEFEPLYPSGSEAGIRSLWDTANDIDSISAWISRLTLSLSNNVRRTGTTSATNDTKYAGTVWSERVRVRVIWPWLAFPGGLVVSSVVFSFLLFLTDEDRGTWKAGGTARCLCSMRSLTSQRE